METRTWPKTTVGYLLAVGVLIEALSVLAGWQFHLVSVVQPFSSTVPMQPNTALCFLLFSLSVLLGNSPSLRIPSILCVFFGLLISVTTLVQFLFDLSLGIDTLFIDPFLVSHTQHPGRMAHNSAFAFTLIGAGLLRISLLEKDEITPIPALVLAAIGGTIGLITVIGYTMGLEVAYGWSDFSHMAPHTGLTFCALGAAIIAVSINRPSSESSRNARLAAVIALTIGLTTTSALWSWASLKELEAIRMKLDLDVQARARIVGSTVASKASALQSVVRFFEGSENVTKEEFSSFVSPLVGREAGVVAIDWSPQVRGEARQQFERTLSEIEGDTVLFKELGADLNLALRSSASLYFPVLFTEPSNYIRNAVGFDHYSDTPRREAMERAYRELKPVSTRPLKLFRLQETGTEASDFLIIVPALGKEPKAVEFGASEINVRGFVLGVFRASWLIEEAFENLPDLGLNLSVRDAQFLSPLYEHVAHDGTLGPANARSYEEPFRVSKSFEVAGRMWELSAYPNSSYLAQAGSWYPLAVLLFGVGLTLGISGYILTLNLKNASVSALVRTKTKELRELNDNLETIVRRRTEEAKEAREFLESVMDGSTTMIYLYDLKRHVPAYLNRACVEFLGRDLDSWNDEAQDFFTHFIHPDDLDLIKKEFEKISLNTTSVVEFEIRARDRQGELRWLFNRVVPFRQDEEGNVTQVVVSAQDITEMKQAEASLRRSEVEFKSAFRNASIGMALVAPNGRWLRINPALSRIIGYTEEELLSKSFQDITHPEDLEKDLKLVQQVLRGEIETYQLEKRYFHKQGNTVWALLSVSLVYDEEGKPLHFISQISDITARKETERVLKEKNEQLSRATEFKSQFLANMSHEIRTPLTGIIGFAESVLKDQLTRAEVEDALKDILGNSHHLLGIINDILDFSKIEAGKLDVEILDTSLFSTISDIQNLMGHRASEKGIALKFNYSFPLPKTIKTDPLRLKQVLINLIGNAIKFTHAGEVTCVISCDRASEKLFFTVRDTGIGMTEEQVGRLFQAFIQGDTSTTRKFGGTGLGLVISSQLADKLGGEVRVASEVGKGSTFGFSISTGPLSEENFVQQVTATVKEGAEEKPSASRISGRILLAEDNPVNQKLIAFVLQKAGLEAIVVENGELAVKMASEHSFDLILMDMQMPVMDGYTAVRALREKGFSIPIIALTANVMKQDVAKCLEAGCDDCIGKPFERHIFLEKLAEILSQKT